jgi:hypothetical protein
MHFMGRGTVLPVIDPDVRLFECTTTVTPLLSRALSIFYELIRPLTAVFDQPPAGFLLRLPGYDRIQ